MMSLRTKNVIKYVVPTILSNVCIALFTIVDSAQGNRYEPYKPISKGKTEAYT